MREIVVPDFWLVARTMYGDEDTVIRFRSERPTASGQAKYSILMVLTWRYSAKRDGMPRKADLQAMLAFEDALDQVVKEPKVGIHVACLTGGGRRTWRYYVADV